MAGQKCHGAAHQLQEWLCNRADNTEDNFLDIPALQDARCVMCPCMSSSLGGLYAMQAGGPWCIDPMQASWLRVLAMCHEDPELCWDAVLIQDASSVKCTQLLGLSSVRYKMWTVMQWDD